MDYLNLEDLNQLGSIYNDPNRNINVVMDKGYSNLFSELSPGGRYFDNTEGYDIRKNEQSAKKYIEDVLKIGHWPQEEQFREIVNIAKSNFIYDQLSDYRYSRLADNFALSKNTNKLKKQLLGAAGNVSEITTYFKQINDDKYIFEDRNEAKQAFYDIVKRGMNKEQIKLRLLVDERQITQELVYEGRKGEKYRDNNEIESLKSELKKIYALKKDLDKIKGPYDALFDMSEEIANLKRINADEKIELDADQFEANEDRIKDLKNQIQKETAKYDPRIIEDAINDKIRSKKIEVQIDNIKGIEQNDENNLDPEQLLEQNLRSLKMQVAKDINFINQNKDYNL